jgi:peptide/nickel transport system substrate-binding protein
MRDPRHRLRGSSSWSTAGLALAALLGLSGCTLPGSGPTPSPDTTSAAPRPFTVMSTDPIRVADPAAVADAGSAVLSLNVFQRLMTAEPGEGVLKPDAARDCIFSSSTTYTCTLNKKLFFHNGDPVTSADVKFSIQRATRLNVRGSSAPLLSSLRRIDTPDAMTIRFVLSRVDTQFGWALASPSASIVDRRLYNPDEIRPASAPVVGSGPFSVTSFTPGELTLARYPKYVGHDLARNNVLVYRTAPDSAAVEEAMQKGTTDVVWRGLNSAAVTRYSQQTGENAEKLTTDGFRQRVLTGVRVHQLQWSPQSGKRGDKALRSAIQVALQEDRTLDSDVPGGVTGHSTSFAVGGRGRPKVTWSNRIQLNLAYDPTSPDSRDLANQIRSRLEDTGGLSVRLRPDSSAADLVLLDRKAWTATPLAWLQPYLEAPLPESRATVTRLQNDYRSTTSETEATRLLAALQRQAAVDGVLLPVSQGDEHLFAREGVDIDEDSFGPGWQLGLFGMKNG